MDTELKIIKKNEIKFNVVSSKNVDHWHSLVSGNWESDTFRIFDNFLSKDCVYLDIGAWIGSTILYAAQLAKKSYAFEPDPVAYQELKANVDANKNDMWASQITIYNKAIAPRSGEIKIGSKTCEGDSMSSVLFADENTNWAVEAITLDELIEGEKLVNEKLFIKMDIEGGEYELMPRLKRAFKRYEIILFLSMHPEYRANSSNDLLTNKKNSLVIKILNRLLMAWQQIKLIRALPFRYLYYKNGKRTNLFREILKNFSIHTTHTTEVVASNKLWEKGFAE